jgi:GTP cyclohydrolase I
MDLIKSNENRIVSQQDIQKTIENATKEYGKFLTALGFDWQNDVQMAETPKRVSKMMVEELMSGCYKGQPNITAFDNEGKYDGLVFSGHIEVNSLCAHHIVNFRGKAYIAYIPSPTGKVVGLSKLNRIVDFFARRPQIQENLTMQIAEYIDKMCVDNLGVAVLIEAEHLCVSARGVKQNSRMITSKLTGAFKDIYGASRKEFYDNINFVKNN